MNKHFRDHGTPAFNLFLVLDAAFLKWLFFILALLLAALFAGALDRLDRSQLVRAVVQAATGQHEAALDPAKAPPPSRAGMPG